jgi:cholesterol oxidase
LLRGNPLATQHFNAVIVGSGFGGSVMAYRLADAGLTVCVLERGKPYPPGSFPRSPYNFRNSLWDPSEGQYGLYNTWSFRGGISAIVSAGLGGGSLIYANVLLRKDEKWFGQEDLKSGAYDPWPVTRAELEPHYDAVERVLAPQVYPADFKPYSETPRLIAFREAADVVRRQTPDMSWFLPPLAITFYNPGSRPVPGEFIREEYPNLHHRQRATCRLCSECYVGCNYGSKNTLDYNYLSLAAIKGAEIWTLREVRSFRPRAGGGFEIDYVQHVPAGQGQPAKSQSLPVQRVTSNQLILSGGTLGSTYLLLKNRDAFPGLSGTLGSRFSGNGDYLGIAYECTESGPNAPRPRIIDATFGPAIVSTIRMQDTVDGGSGPGLYIQDCGFPSFIDWTAELANQPAFLVRAARYALNRLRAWVSGGRDAHTEVADQLRALLGSCEISAGTMALLGMGRDTPAGTMSLLPPNPSGQRLLDADFPEHPSRTYLNRMRDTARRLAEAMGGKFIEDPVTKFLKRLITVHPLGGAPMGKNDLQGVVDPFGEVFNHPGLFIADGSVMPGPVGPNPSLTIAALSHRTAEFILERRARKPT